MKRFLGLILGVMLVVGQAGDALAVVAYRQLRTVLPGATSIRLDVHQVVTTNGNSEFHPWSENELSFGTAVYNSTYGYWAPGYGFAIDVAPVDAQGNPAPGIPQVTVSCNNFQLNNAPTQVHGLNYKGILTFVKAVWDENATNHTQETILLGGSGKRMGIVNNQTITPAMLTGGWLRLYVNIYTGAPYINGAEVFTSNDQPGSYAATIQISAVVP